MAKKTVVKESEVQVIKRDGSVALTPETRAKVEGILAQINRDIGNAELGRFFALRAGCGLIVVKELCEHGEWGSEMVRMIPNRSPRTLRNYMNNARDFLENKELMARDVWDKLLGVGQLEQTAGRLLLGDGKKPDEKTVSKIPKEVLAMAEYIRGEPAGEKPPRPAASEGAKPGKTSKAERVKAARDFWHPAASRIQKAGITDRLWELLDDDELESVQSAFMSVALAMRAELKTRGK